MSKKILSLLVVMLLTLSGCYSQAIVSVRSVSDDISDNLNLEAVATLFGDSRNLQDFEERLNNPRNQISNLDLNGDGYVDYIRVVQNYENGVYLITLQDVLGHQQYQDLATIDVTRNSYGNVRIEIIGNPYFYGSNYVIEPIFRTKPVIFSIFWNPFYRLWVSPYHWNYYPRYFRPWRPYALYRYRMHIRPYMRGPHYYRYLKTRSYRGRVMYHHRNAYEKMHPKHSFHHRNQGYRNAREMYQKRGGYNHNIRRSNPNVHRQQNQNRNVRTNRVNKQAPVKYRKAKPVRYNRERPGYVPRKLKPSGNRNVNNRSRKVYNKKDTYRSSRTKKVKKDKDHKR